MVMALGLGSSEAAMFHLTTHAFFKALLFLGAGAIIHALHTQDIREMGGLLKQMPLVAVTFLIGALALCGVPPLSGFWSKDEILLLAFEHNKLIYVTALFTAMLTAFYMARAVWIAVLGPKRAHKHEHVHETPWVMKAPLLALAFFSIVAGFIDIPEFLMGGHTHHTLNIAVARMSVVVAFLGLGLGTLVYAKSRAKTDPLQNALGGFHTFLIQKYYLDDFFLALARFFDSLVARVLFWFDSNMVIRTLVNGSAALTRGAGSILRKSQTGQLQTYAMTFGFGVVALVAFWMMQ
jgi:NADH-quinone oxidoreductase subunit L